MDNGQGIPVEIQKNIFKSFFTTKQIGSGTGIGLALSRSIVENCGGSLNFQSDPNGTVFYADFPKAGALMPEAVEKAEHDSTQVPLRVLVVDDEEDIREILAEILSESNCIVTEAATAEIALKEVRAVEFDVIMTDMQMPGMDGLTLLSEINASKLAPLAVKAVITGGETKDIEDKISDFRLGTVDACLGKPFATEQLLGLLDMALRRKKVALKTAS